MSSSDALLNAAKRHLVPSYQAPPFIADHGKGAQLWDMAGRRYLDFAGGMGVNALGHAHPDVVAAITKQAAALCHTSNAYFHAPHIALSEKLAQLSFGQRVFLCNSGTEAIEAALKLARRFFFDKGAPRPRFVATLNGFHGRTMGALSVTGQETYRKGFAPLVESVEFVPYNDSAPAVQAITKDTAAFIMELVQGNGGVVLPPPGYLRAVHAACQAQGALLIVDEIQTGIGRTGKWFAYEHEGVVPDIMCLAKALGGGLPLGAMVTTDALGQVFQPGVHGTTFGGNAVACAAGLATMHVIERDNLLAHATKMGALYMEMLRTLQKRHKRIVEVRGRGLLIGIQLSEPVKPAQAVCREKGLLTTAAGPNVIRLFPPLNVTHGELEESISLLDAALAV